MPDLRVRLTFPPISPPHSRGSPSPSDMKFCHKILERLSYHMVKTQSLYLSWYQVMTDTKMDRRTDRITVANTHYS